MKKIIEILIALIILFSSYQQPPAGGAGSANGRLTVTATPWGGGIIFGYEALPCEYDLVVGVEYALPAVGGYAITFQITNISEEGIVFKTSERLIIVVSDEVGWDNSFMEFEIKYGNGRMLSPSASNAGFFYVFELSKN